MAKIAGIARREQKRAETDPCSRMEEACPGPKNALQPDWRGGVSCSVLKGGSIAVGDRVSLREQQNS